MKIYLFLLLSISSCRSQKVSGNEVVGHQWTNIGLLLQDRLIPLRPLPFESQRSCREHQRTSRTEPDRVVADSEPWNLEDASGAEEPRQVVVVTASGSDKKKRQTASAAQPWHGLLALGNTRSVPAPIRALTTPKTKQWGHMATVFRPHRWRKWPPMRRLTHGTKRKRREWRPRDTMGYLRSVGQGPWVCSAPRKRPDGRRTSGACKDLSVTARQILLGDRLRWARELLQKTVKPSLGFEAGATRGCAAVMAPGHWVDGASLGLSMAPPGVTAGVTSLGDAQRQRQQLLANQEKRRLLQKWTQIGGVQRSQDELRRALAAACFLGCLTICGLQGLHGFVGATFKNMKPVQNTLERLAMGCHD